VLDLISNCDTAAFHDRRVDGLPISAECPFEDSIHHEVDQVGVDFAIVVSQAVGDPHEILNDSNSLVEGEANRSLGLRCQ